MGCKVKLRKREKKKRKKKKDWRSGICELTKK